MRTENIAITWMCDTCGVQIVEEKGSPPTWFVIEDRTGSITTLKDFCSAGCVKHYVTNPDFVSAKAKGL